MSTRSKLKVPARLIRGRQCFDKFRKTHKGYRRLPEALWSAAVKLAQTYDVIRRADRIWVIGEGRILQDGTYDSLSGTDGPFRRLHQLSTGEPNTR